MTDDVPAPSASEPAREDGSGPADDAEHAPRPRPGYRSRRAAEGAFETAQLAAGVLRASLGAAGLFAAILYLPIQTATPILAGVSILMMVTGCTSTWRAVRNAPPRLRRIPLFLMSACALSTLMSVVLTLVFGAGAFGPVPAAREQARQEALKEAAPTVRFEPAP